MSKTTPVQKVPLDQWYDEYNECSGKSITRVAGSFIKITRTADDKILFEPECDDTHIAKFKVYLDKNGIPAKCVVLAGIDTHRRVLCLNYDANGNIISQEEVFSQWEDEGIRDNYFWKFILWLLPIDQSPFDNLPPWYGPVRDLVHEYAQGCGGAGAGQNL